MPTPAELCILMIFATIGFITLMIKIIDHLFVLYDKYERWIKS